VTGSYDPELDKLYWGVGNPAPVYAGDVRRGDNLFTNSVIALHGHSGKLVWYFQFTPHDEHDWDSAQTPVLADLVIDGVKRKVILWANRNGFYYVLDRVTGKFLTGRPFVEQNWAKALDRFGRPIPTDVFNVTSGGRLTRPGIAGGTNWQPSAFDPKAGLFFVVATEGASVFTNSKNLRRGEQGLFLGSGYGGGAEIASPITFVRALDAATGVKRWEYRAEAGAHGGLLATAGGLVFGAAGGTLFALNAASGEELWRVPLGGDTWSPPISFTLDGRQVIAVSAGRALFLFGL
jgi:alcohol dehydrogenase (cytochrome c)